jgi:hypothetical protein
MRPARVLFLIIAAAIGCTAHVKSNARVNGVPFAADGCRSGRPFGFDGVRLTDRNGRRLNLSLGGLGWTQNYPSPPRSGTPVATLFEPGEDRGTNLGACGQMRVAFQESKVLGHRNIEGSAMLVCRSAAYEIAGSLQFENCH